MGVNCSKDNVIQLADDINKNMQNQGKKDSLHISTPMNLIEILGKANIEGKLKEVVAEIENKKDREGSSYLHNDKTEGGNNEIDMWLETEKTDSEARLHRYRVEMPVPFTPELIQLFLLNLKEEIFTTYNYRAESFQIVDSVIGDDLIVYVVKASFKDHNGAVKRERLVARVVKRLTNNDMLEFSQSVRVTPMVELKEYEEALSKIDNEEKVVLEGCNARKTDQGSQCTWFIRVETDEDLETEELKKNVGKILATNNDRMQLQLTRFAVTVSENDQLLWFTDDKADVKRIIDENKALLEKSKVDLEELRKTNFDMDKFEKPSNDKLNNVLLSKVPDFGKNVKDVLVKGVDQVGDIIESKLQEKKKEEEKKGEEGEKKKDDMLSKLPEYKDKAKDAVETGVKKMQDMLETKLDPKKAKEAEKKKKEEKTKEEMIAEKLPEYQQKAKDAVDQGIKKIGDIVESQLIANNKTEKKEGEENKEEGEKKEEEEKQGNSLTEKRPEMEKKAKDLLYSGVDNVFGMVKDKLGVKEEEPTKETEKTSNTDQVESNLLSKVESKVETVKEQVDDEKKQVEEQMRQKLVTELETSRNTIEKSIIQLKDQFTANKVETDNKITQLEETDVKLRTMLKDTQAKTEETQGELLENLKEKVTNTQSQLDSNSMLLGLYNREKEHYDNILDKLDNELTSLSTMKTDLSKEQTDMTELQNLLTKKSATVSTIKTTTESYKNELLTDKNKLNELISKSEAKRNELNKECVMIENELNKLDHNTELLKNNRKNSGLIVEEEIAQGEELEKTKKQIEESIKEKENETKELEKRNSVLEETIKQIDSKGEINVAEKEEAVKEMEKVKEQLVENEGAKSELGKKLELLKGEIEILESTKMNLQSTIDEIDEKIKTGAGNKKTLKNKKKKTNKKLKDTEEELNKLFETRDTLDSEIKKVDGLQQTIEKVEKSV